ncbi:hypothetical protein [Alicyclobacillus ferrooxydans]|uniref:Uncharacterized protein n=1 Tax=Alicyclobacillus ferrooxydans TaxID=471514 RepID=A0A0P9CDE4_9BACL|nr:hypothetical protein [Alicyclobacillus ferrooxydans]KPV40859.1 hypothetical protein AN477_21455 [Alicyclobacillus ferrooxydans]
MTVFDTSFNVNEWAIIVGLCIGLSLVIFLPKRFPVRASLVFFMCGVYSGFIFDNSFTTEPYHLYEVNDGSHYQLMDYTLYLAYGPISYLFFYIWDLMSLTSKAVPFYVLIWVLIAWGLEWLSTSLGIFHYFHGYQFLFSMPIYLVVFFLWFTLYSYYKILSAKNMV